MKGGATPGAALDAYAGRVHRIGLETDVVPGVRTLPIPGHTPGHPGVRVSSGDQQVLMIADVVHAQSLQFARPDWSISFDSDPATAARTCARVFDMAATDRIVIAGSHLAFPGLGHVARRTEGFGFVPLMWRSPLRRIPLPLPHSRGRVGVGEPPFARRSHRPMSDADKTRLKAEVIAARRYWAPLHSPATLFERGMRWHIRRAFVAILARSPALARRVIQVLTTRIREAHARMAC